MVIIRLRRMLRARARAGFPRLRALTALAIALIWGVQVICRVVVAGIGQLGLS